MAAVMQEPLLCRMSVRRNVALGLRFRRFPKADIQGRVASWLKRLAISDLADRPAGKLSGGEAQRTSLARAMVLEPEVLFLDEPFSALDAPTRQNLLQEFRSVLSESGVTSVFATHDRGEALALEGRTAVLVRGSVAQVGPTEEVFSRPEREEVARFVGVETLIPARVVGHAHGRIEMVCGELVLLSDCEGVGEGCPEVGEEVLVAVRPEEITLEQGAAPSEEDPPNLVPGKVASIIPGESHYRVVVDAEAQVVAMVARARFREMELVVGQAVFAVFPPRAAHWIQAGR
jgi:tungstate transport system ATP-binding protein